MDPCCCNLGTCVIYQDDFNRADDTDLGTNWNEISGDWQISGNTLTEAGTANAKVLCTLPNTRSGRASVGAEIKPVNGDKYRAIVNSNAIGTVFKYVEVECLTGSVILTTGTQTRTYTTAHGWDVTARPMYITVCFTDGILRLSVGHQGFQGVVWDNTVTVTNANRYAGLMNGGTSALTFDDFYYRHVDDDGLFEGQLCGGCGCYCIKPDGKKFYPSWRLHLEGFCECCPDCCCCAWEGWCADLEFDALTEKWLCVSSGTMCGKTYPGTGPAPDLPYGGYGPEVWCENTGTGHCDWFLTHFICCHSNDAYPVDCEQPVNYCDEQPADTLVCDPFSLQWDFNWETGDPLCGCCEAMVDASCEYYLILTEGICA